MSIKPLLLAAGLVATALTSYAQTSPTQPDATAQTREMASRFKLNEGQYVRLLAVNRTRLTRQQQIEHTTKDNPAARSAQMAELQGQYEQECGRILSPSQLSQLQQDGAPQQPTGVANGNG